MNQITEEYSFGQTENTFDGLKDPNQTTSRPASPYGYHGMD